jgi:8-oxo-dGTP diphosphatase
MKEIGGVILVRKDGAVLLQHRDDIPSISYPDHWCFPGGLREEGESPEETSRREFFEETGYRVDKLFPLGKDEYVNDRGEHVRRHAFWAQYDDIQVIRCLEGKEMRFLKPEEWKGRKLIVGQEGLFLKAIREAATLR